MVSAEEKAIYYYAFVHYHEAGRKHGDLSRTVVGPLTAEQAEEYRRTHDENSFGVLKALVPFDEYSSDFPLIALEAAEARAEQAEAERNLILSQPKVRTILQEENRTWGESHRRPFSWLTCS